jgi:hypothetical protein
VEALGSDSRYAIFGADRGEVGMNGGGGGGYRKYTQAIVDREVVTDRGLVYTPWFGRRVKISTGYDIGPGGRSKIRDPCWSRG